MKFFDASGGARVQTNERQDRYAEAMRDPGAIVERRVVTGVYPGLDRPARETLSEWQVRAVMAVADAELHAAAVPEGWHVVNPRYMADLKAAEAKLARVEALAEEWGRNNRDADPWYWSDAADELLASLKGDE